MARMNPLRYAQDQLHHLPSDTPLIVLHPHFYGQHRLLGIFLEDQRAQTLFVTIPATSTPFRDFLHILQEACETQFDCTLPPLPQKATAAASALAKKLQAHSPVTLIIDAYDLAEPQDRVPFVATLIAQLRPGDRVVLTTRELPRELLRHPKVRGKVALVPVQEEEMLLDYATMTEKTVLEVRALGLGRVLVNGRRVERWDGVLPKLLFHFFVDRGMTTRDEIFQTFWPKLKPREATNVFHVTKRKISEILGTDLTVYWSGFYRISPELELHYDAVKFAEAVQNAAVASDDDAIAFYRNAIALYRGQYLSGSDHPWAEHRREELHTTYTEALIGLGRIHRRLGHTQKALSCFLRALATTPRREDLARTVMEVYRDMGLPADALHIYEQLEHNLRHELGIMPDQLTVSLANEVRAQL